jgi:hypothetical protein
MRTNLINKNSVPWLGIPSWKLSEKSFIFEADDALRRKMIVTVFFLCFSSINKGYNKEQTWKTNYKYITLRYKCIQNRQFKKHNSIKGTSLSANAGKWKVQMFRFKSELLKLDHTSFCRRVQNFFLQKINLQTTT